MKSTIRELRASDFFALRTHLRCVLTALLILDLPALPGVAFSEQPDAPQLPVVREHRTKDRYGDPLPAFAVARLGSTRLKHGATVNSLAFSPDGRTVASVSGESLMPDAAVVIWSVAHGRSLRRLDLLYDVSLRQPDPGFSCHPSEGSVPVFAPDGSALALPCTTKVLVWDLTAKTATRLLGQEDRTVHGCAFSPEGKLLAWGSVVLGPTGPSRQMIEVCEVATGRLVRGIKLPSQVRMLRGSPKDPFVAAALQDGTAGLWDITTGARLWPTGQHKTRAISEQDKIRLVAVSPDGKSFATASDNGISTWNVSTGKKVLSIRQGLRGMHDLAFVPPGQLLAGLMHTPAGLGELLAWNATTGDRVQRIGITGWPRQVAFSPNGKLLARPLGGAVALRRFPNNTDPLDIQGHMDLVPFVAFLSDGEPVSWGRDCKAFLWDLAAARPIWELSNLDYQVPIATGPQAVAVSPQKRLLAIAFRGRGVEIWNAVDRNREKTLLVGESQLLSAVQFSPDGDLLACGDLEGNLLIVDVQSGRAVRKWSRDEWIRDNGGIERRTEALPWHGNKTIRMWVTGIGMEIQCLAWSMDGKTIVSATPAKVRWLDVRTGKVVRESPESPGIFSRYVTFSPNGEMLAEFDNQMDCVVWDAASGRRIWTDSDGEGGFVESTVAFSPDSTLLAGGDGHSIRLVDAATGRERAIVSTGQSRVVGVGFSADGRLLAAGGADGTIVIVDVPQVLESTCGESTDSGLRSTDVRDAENQEGR